MDEQLKMNVVVIDDDDLARSWVLTTLEISGFQVVGAKDGLSGMRVIQEVSPALVLCDVNMPEHDGYTVLERLRTDQRTANIPFVFMTARSERNDMRKGMELGADDYLTKPFTPAELLSAVNTQLEKRRAITEKYETTIKQLRTNIIYALPHELRTPLTGSLGYAELLMMDAEQYTPDDVREIARHIVKNNRRLYRVLENFLVYAQIEVLAANPEQLARLRNHITAHVGPIVSDCAQAVADKYCRSDDLVLDTADFAARIAQGDLVKIVNELVDNAFKFSDPGSPVVVRAFRDQTSFGLSIMDQGRGITQEQQSLIGAYMQFNRALYEQQGLGFGLIIARRLVELHRGSIIINSEIDKGTGIFIKCLLYD